MQHIGRDVDEARNPEVAKELAEMLDDAYRVAGLHPGSGNWKPALPQKVLFPRKPPASVQQQWHEQRHANCMAEIDQAIADQEAVRKSSA